MQFKEFYKHRRLLYIPLNEKGIGDWNYNNDTDDVRCICFSEAEYEYMTENHLFDLINAECNLLIDDYEEDIIRKEHFSTVQKILEEHKNNIPTFMEALSMAKECDTFVEVVL